MPLKRIIIKANTEADIMQTVIYADILVTVNIIVNYLLLKAGAAMAGCDCKTVRIFFASCLGGAFSLIIFVENIPVWLNAAIKLLMLVVLVLTAFGVKSSRAFAKCCGTFFLANFIFAGLMLGVCTAVFPNYALYKNGVVYFDIDILTLTLGSVGCYLILTLITKFTKSKIPEKSIYSLKIFYGENFVEGKALFDSGNSLCDCFSGRPAIIAENDFVSPLFCGNDLTAMKNFRLIPFSTIKSGGALPAFSADKVEITINARKISAENIYIAVTNKKIVSGGYSALIGTPFFDAINNEIGRKRVNEKV